MAKKTNSEKKNRRKKVTINKRNKRVIKTEKKIKYEKSKFAAIENSFSSNQNTLNNLIWSNFQKVLFTKNKKGKN